MKISGIICEYNPLHSGHIEHIRYTRSFSDTVICIMSGNFTQRGMPACLDKYVRARHAILAGADIVLELPTVFATASAENFAYGAVRILDALRCDYLSFGSECGDIDLIEDCAKTLAEPSTTLTSSIKSNIAKGITYAAAVYASLVEKDSRYADFSKPNNILAVEYVRNIYLLNSLIQPITLKRQDNYSDCKISGQYISSDAIRRNLGSTAKIKRIASHVPEYVLADLKPPIDNRFEEFAYTYLSTVNKDYLSHIEGVNEGLENRIINCSQAGDYNKFMEQLKTKRYTRARLQRVILNCLLGIDRSVVTLAKKTKPYARVLAISRKRLDLLTHLSKSPISHISELSSQQKDIYVVDERAGKMYTSLTKESGNRDLTMPLQKI